MSARHCALCGVNWPKRPQFRRCPECEARTSVRPDAEPLADDEADTRRKRAEFDRYYAAREERRLAQLEDYDAAQIGDEVERELNAG